MAFGGLGFGGHPAVGADAGGGVIADVLSGQARYHVECGEALAVLAGLRVDAVITDAPFGIGDDPIVASPFTGRRARGARCNDWHPPSTWDKEIDPAWGAACCAAAPVVAWFGFWRKREEVAATIPYPLRCEIVWAKDCHTSPPTPIASRDERIWIFAADALNPRHFETTVWDEPIIPTWAHRNHKNEKPLPLMRRLVRWLTDPGQVIADPFCGSGSTVVAAVQEGRRGIGGDIDPAYVEIARARLQNVSAGNPPAPVVSAQLGLALAEVPGMRRRDQPLVVSPDDAPRIVHSRSKENP